MKKPITTILRMIAIIFFLSMNSLAIAQTDEISIKTLQDDPEERVEFERRMLIDPVTGQIPDNIRNKELNFVLSSQSRLQPENTARASQPNWTRRGPYNVGGRTRALAIDRTNENIILAGGVAGGMWRSNDGGQTWVKTTTSLQFHNVTCLVQDPRTGYSNVWYFGTGEGIGNSASGGSAAYRGNGIYKSTDGGNSWSQLSSTLSDPTISGGGSTFGTVGSAATGGDFQYIWNIAINPLNGNLYTATYSGIMYSTDGGISWLKVLGTFTGNTPVLRRTDVAVNANGLAIATLEKGSTPNEGFWSSTNGTSWNSLTNSALAAFTTQPTSYTRIVIGNNSSSPNIFYFFMAITGGTGNTSGFGLLKYDFNASQWQNLSVNLPTYGGSVGNMGQAAYNQYIRLKPDDLKYIFLGTTNLNRSVDGFSSPVNITTDPNKNNWIGGYASANDVSRYLNHHPDNHNLVFFPSNPKKAISANDGGISVTEDITANPVVWKTLNNGYFTTQAYAVAIDEYTAGDMRMMAGFQDNGKWTTYGTSSNDTWYEEFGGGDGCYIAMVPNAATNGHRRYTSTQGGRILRFDGIDVNNYTKADGIQPSSAFGQLFVHPFILDPADFNKMYYPAGASIWYNSNLNGINSGYTFSGTSTNWTLLSNSSIGVGETITAIAASKAPVSSIVYYGSSLGKLYRLNNAPTNPTPVNIASPSFPANAYVSGIAVDKKNDQNVMMVFSNYGVKSVWYSSNAGNSWTDVSGNLEQFPDGTGNGPSVRWAEIMNLSSGGNAYFVGTSTGLYYTELLNGTSTIWSQQSPDLVGNSVVAMVKSRESDGFVAIATHANGLFSAFYGTSDLPPIAVKEIADVTVYKNDSPTKVDITGSFTDPDNSASGILVSIQSNTNAALITPSINGNILTITYNSNQVGTSFVTVRATSNGKYVDEIFKVTVLDFNNSGTLYDQISTVTQSGGGFRIGRYTDLSYAALDNFAVPTGQTWTVTGINASVFTLNTGSPSLSSYDVFIYQDNGGLVGNLKDSIRVNTSNVANLPLTNNASSILSITLPSAINLNAGKYWLRISGNFNNSTTTYRLVWFATTSSGDGINVTPADKRPFTTINLDYLFSILGTASGTTSTVAPTTLSAKAISLSQIKLDWKDNSSYESGHLIERSTNPGTGYSIVARVGSNITTWTDNTGLSLNTNYYYRVAAFDIVGNSGYSNEASTIITNVPTTPTGLTLTTSTDSENGLRWNDLALNESGYEVLRSFVQGSGYATIGKLGANQNTFLDQSNLENNLEYYYVVRALASQSNSGFSNEAIDLFTPSNLTADTISGGGGILLKWNDNTAREDAYKVERSTSTGTGFTEIVSLPFNSKTYTDNTVKVNTRYYYRVRASAINGLSAYSKEANTISSALVITSLNKNSMNDLLQVYPNPSDDFVVVRLDNITPKEIKVEVISLQGQVLERQIMAWQSNYLQTVISVKSYMKGVYILKISDGSNMIERKIVVN